MNALSDYFYEFDGTTCAVSSMSGGEGIRWAVVYNLSRLMFYVPAQIYLAFES